MATKPATLPRPWATNAVYATGPFAGQPGKVDPGVGVAAEGHRPGANDPTAAEHENYQQNLITASWIPWVNSGSSAGAADAHIVETAASGRATLHGLTVTDLASEIAVAISGANSVASGLPTVNITNTTGGPIVNVQSAAAAQGVAISVNMVGAMTGDGLSVSASATSSGDCINVAVPSGSSSKGLNVISESATQPAAYFRSADAGMAVEVLGNDNTAMLVTAGTANIAVDIVGSATATRALRVTGSNAYCIQGIAAAGGAGGLFVGGTTGSGAAILSGSTAGAHAVVADVDNNSGFAVYATTDASAVSASRAGYFEAFASGVGIEAKSADNYALLLTPDTTAPTVGSIAQSAAMNAAPTSVVSGQLGYVGSTFDTWMHSSFADTAWRSMWSTLGGYCYASHVEQIQSNNNEAAYTTLCTVTFASPNAPKLAGQKVRISVTIRAGLAAATASIMDVRVRDTTAVATVVSKVGTGLTSANGYYMPALAVATVFQTAISFETEYTIPAAGARTFVLEFKRNAATTTITAQGTMIISGMH